MFPAELAKSSIEEYYWPKDAAISAIEHLRKHNCPVVGVEHAKKLGDKWQILDYSTYDSELDDLKKSGKINKSEFLQSCQERARDFIKSKIPNNDEYFILTWLEDGEY